MDYKHDDSRSIDTVIQTFFRKKLLRKKDIHDLQPVTKYSEKKVRNQAKLDKTEILDIYFEVFIK